MKKRLTGFLTAAILLLTATVTWAAESPSQTLVSLSYLNQTFWPNLQTQIETQVRQQTANTYQEAQNRLDQIGNSRLAQNDKNNTVQTSISENGSAQNLESWNFAGSFQNHSMKRGDTVLLKSGSGFVWQAGRGNGGVGLIDVTEGTALGNQGPLTPGHRYVNGGAGSVLIQAVSDSARASVEGFWISSESKENVTPFLDLAQSDWFYSEVRDAIDRGLFQGVTEDTFAPNAGMERSMLAEVLYRMAGKPANGETGAFSDVLPGQWYTQSVEWAAACGIVMGYEDGSFHPSDQVTREQIALMLYRYAAQRIGPTEEVGDLSVFSDEENISPWAREAVEWAVGAGILTGSDTGVLMPDSTATRAQVAAMLSRLSKSE